VSNKPALPKYCPSCPGPKPVNCPSSALAKLITFHAFLLKTPFSKKCF